MSVMSVIDWKTSLHTVSSDVSNRLGDITTQSEQPSASGPIDGSWGLNKDQGGFPLNRQNKCKAQLLSDTLPLNDFMSHKGPT